MERRGFTNRTYGGRNFNYPVAEALPNAKTTVERFDFNLNHRGVDLGATFKVKSHQLKDHTVYSQVSGN